MSSSQALICKVTVGFLALICTILLTLELSHPTYLSISRSLGFSLNHVASKCTHGAKENKATVHTIFDEKLGLKDSSRGYGLDGASTTMKPKLRGLWVQRNETYTQGWGISMFHALHCLEMMRDNSKAKPTHHAHGLLGGPAADGEHDPHMEEHVQHCFSYIAQVIMCGGDGTIEPPWEEKDDSGNILKDGIDGDGYQHECRDTRRLWEISLQSEEHALEPWNWQMGDTVESLNLRSPA